MDTGDKPENQRERAWSYYQHADTLQHSRHNIFIVAQSIFFAVYAAGLNENSVRHVVVVMGIAYSLLWFTLSERLHRGMTALNDTYLEPNQAKRIVGDPTYGCYLRGLDRWPIPLSGRLVLNVLLPFLTVIAWLWLAFAKPAPQLGESAGREADRPEVSRFSAAQFDRAAASDRGDGEVDGMKFVGSAVRTKRSTQSAVELP